MNKNNSYKKIIILIFIFMMLLSANNSSSLILDIDEEDGVYFVDIFNEGVNVDLTNCTTSKENGRIILDPYGSNTRLYDYSDWNIESEDKAYSYPTPYFFLLLPPKISITLFEREFDNELDYDTIKNKNNIFYPLEEFDESSPLKIVHHYRFKIKENINFTNEINIYWCGKAENEQKITFYYWQPVGSIGKWEEAASGVSNSSVIEIQQNFTGDLFIGEDNYIDICIVATPDFGERCSLFTDYVKITVYGQGSSSYGAAISSVISPNYLDRWEFLLWEDYEKSGTSIRYHILYENETGDFNLIDDSYLSGNEEGFTSSPVYLDSLPLYDIKILANLSTINPSLSPEIDSWSLIWQTSDKIWSDQFSSSFRIDEVDNILFSNDEAKLILSVNDWPMFGKNSENTRSSDSYGPDADNHSLYWYSTTKSGSEYRNPILKNNILYIASIDGDILYAFNATIPLGDEGSTILPVDQSDIPQNTIESSPALTEDGKLIVASGTRSNDGDIDNKVFAYNTQNILSENTIWEFNYSDIDPDNPYICYSASPTIYEDKILISSWSGKNSIWNSLWNYFNLTYGNNKIIALNFDGNLEWEYDLPAGSFSTPAAQNDIVIVGCENKDGNSIFALDANNGDKLWDNNIGPIGRSCPLIYDDKVFIITKEIGIIPFTGYESVIALDLSDGSELWNLSIGDNIADNYEKIAGASPSVNNGILFTVSADGTVYALDINNGDEIWTKKIYTKSLTSPYFLVSSPVSINNILYIGTPDGIIYALNITDGSIIWQEDTYQNSPIQNSPIVVDGVIYYSSENGILYSRGVFKGIEGEVITGSIISIPISLPNPNYIWNKFYVEYSTYEGEIDFYILDKMGNILLDDISDGSNISKSNVNNHDTIRLRADFSANYSSNISGEAILFDWSVTFKQEGDLDYETIFYENSFYSIDVPPICGIDVQNQYVGLMDSAQYRFEYENQLGNFISEWYDADFSGIEGTFERETITADTSEADITDNISIYLKIQFKINDAGIDQNETRSDWYDIEYDNPDIESPIFFEDSFLPEEGWISKNNPICSINVKDEGTEGNITGLNVYTASYTLRYSDQAGVHSHTEKTTNNGINGSISTIKITADISQLEFINDILNFQQIRFYIEDLAGNKKYSNYFELKTDDEKPISWIINTDEIPIKTNIKSVKIDATAEDDISDIHNVTLFYLKPEFDDWKEFETDYNYPYSWDFTIDDDEGGEIELCTIATDLANNREDFPTIGDISFIFDPNKPTKPIFNSEYIFENNTIPFFDEIIFEDDYKLKNVEYRLDFHDQDKWIMINKNNIDADKYITLWNLTKDDWDYMVEDFEYYIYFRITDSLENIYETPSKQDAVKIIKNLQKNVITTPYDPDISDLNSLNWNNIYQIIVNISDNDISEIKLLYRYSQNNENWSSWIQYGESINSSPFEWDFSVDNGSGFYEFKTQVLDSSGKYHDSEIQSANVILFPTYLIIAMVISIIFLLIVTAIIIKRFKK
ncbi:MAG: PQQ-binding-like beta-propeller repeat protein [Candidatus Thermoplasmatota archaeon]|nr:PQQ-binding-like beta-propeller repeat protein [Candidatus Thermoplasmatota archaeon]